VEGTALREKLEFQTRDASDILLAFKEFIPINPKERSRLMKRLFLFVVVVMQSYTGRG
jgi:hypothetical protein